MRMTIRMKLFVGFLMLLILLALTGGVAIFKMAGISGKTQDIDEKSVPSVMLLADMNKNVAGVDGLLSRFIFATESEQQHGLESRLNAVISEVNLLRGEYASAIIDPEERKMYEQFAVEWEQYEAQAKAIIQMGPQKDLDAGNALLNVTQPILSQAETSLYDLTEFNRGLVKQETQSAMLLNDSGKQWVLMIGGIALLLGLILALVISQRIAEPVRRTMEQVKKVAAGDLMVEPLTVKSRDEIGDLVHDFNGMVENWRDILHKVTLNSQQVAATSEQLTASAEQTSRATEQITESVQSVALGADRQLGTATEMTRFVTTISREMEQAAHSMRAVADRAEAASDIADTGNLVAQKAVEQIDRVNEKVNSSSQVVNFLGEKSRRIGDIVSLITAISGQTNLLALNAAIEAARAGEQGKGFAVVASEVRKLAEQSAEAAEQIRYLISEMQQGTERAIQAMGEGTAAVQEGRSLVHEAGESFHVILQSIQEVTLRTKQVTAAVESVNIGTQNMVQAMEGMANISEQSAENTGNVAAAAEEQHASMEEITAAATTLAKMAGELQDSVGTFRV